MAGSRHNASDLAQLGRLPDTNGRYVLQRYDARYFQWVTEDSGSGTFGLWESNTAYSVNDVFFTNGSSDFPSDAQNRIYRVAAAIPNTFANFTDIPAASIVQIGGGGGGLIYQDLPPTDVTEGTLWYTPLLGKTFVYNGQGSWMNDGDAIERIFGTFGDATNLTPATEIINIDGQDNTNIPDYVLDGGTT